MRTVTSEDGAPIAYERRGSGPAVILIGGGLDDGSDNAPLAAELAGDFSTYNYARRGRGASGDSAQYAVERELDDLAALIAEAGGRAHVYGGSSGGMFALEARWPASRRVQGTARRGAPLAYDAALYGPPPLTRLATIAQPTLVASGGATSFFEASADAAAASVPNAERVTLAGQGHVVDPEVMPPCSRASSARGAGAQPRWSSSSTTYWSASKIETSTIRSPCTR